MRYKKIDIETIYWITIIKLPYSFGDKWNQLNNFIEHIETFDMSNKVVSTKVDTNCEMIAMIFIVIQLSRLQKAYYEKS
jgi:hypothetical protein